ncbi:MAG: hypothetical protein Q9193_003560 [Seirophora villosa]
MALLEGGYRHLVYTGVVHGLTNVMYAIGVLREVADSERKDLGPDAHAKQKRLSVKIRNIVISVLDEHLMDRTWDQIHDVLDILLLCVYINKVSVETAGTFFDIASQKRFATVTIAAALPTEEDEEVTES